MNSDGDGLQDVIDRLRARGLMPAVKAIESGAGGWVRVTVIGTADEELRGRLEAAMGSTRWKLIEAQDFADGALSSRDDPFAT